MRHSSSLSLSDSPLTLMFIGQYVSKLMQETTYLKLSYDTLAHEMSIPELVLRDAVEGKMGLTRGQWVKFDRFLGLPTTYQLRPGERDCTSCWEICFPARCSHGEQGVVRHLSIAELVVFRWLTTTHTNEGATHTNESAPHSVESWGAPSFDQPPPKAAHNHPTLCSALAQRPVVIRFVTPKSLLFTANS